MIIPKTNLTIRSNFLITRIFRLTVRNYKINGIELFFQSGFSDLLYYYFFLVGYFRMFSMKHFEFEREHDAEKS